MHIYLDMYIMHFKSHVFDFALESAPNIGLNLVAVGHLRDTGSGEFMSQGIDHARERWADRWIDAVSNKSKSNNSSKFKR